MNTQLPEDLKARLRPLADHQFDVERIRRQYCQSKGEVAVKNLNKRGFAAQYAATAEEAAAAVCGLVPQGATVGCGDSHTLFALGLDDALREKECTVIPHASALNAHAIGNPEHAKGVVGTREEMRQLLMHYLVSDVFLLGANAITIDGSILNTDGRGNRVAGSLYGPGRIVVVAGVNKLVPSLQAARERVGFTAAPMNQLRYEQPQSPCVQLGNCCDCKSPLRMCSITTIIHRCPEDADFHVVIVGETLGF